MGHLFIIYRPFSNVESITLFHEKIKSIFSKIYLFKLLIISCCAMLYSHNIYAADLSIDSSVSYSISSGRISVDIDRVTNNSMGGHSGSLKIKLWASSSSYSGSGSCCNGYIMADFLIDSGSTLNGGAYFYDIERNLSYTSPPSGAYNVVMVLLEYNGADFVIRDYRNFTNTLTVTSGGGGTTNTEEALPVNTNGVRNRSLLDVSDVDVYKIVVDSPGLLDIQLTAQGEDFRASLRATISGAVTLFDDQTGQVLELIVDATPATYFLRIESPNKTYSGGYTVKTIFDPASSSGSGDSGGGTLSILCGFLLCGFIVVFRVVGRTSSFNR